jgi:diphthine-ammonia ligase
VDATALVSGGKDSIYSAYLAECQGWNVRELLTLAPQDPESMMFHTPNLDLVALQAESWGKVHRRVELTGRGEALEGEELERALSGSPHRWIVAGAIASSYQYTRLVKIADRLGRRVYAPLWGKAGLRVVREEVASGLDIRFVHLAAEGLPEGWIGRRLEGELLEERARRAVPPRGFHPAGEGGEFETLVVDAPFFRSRIALDAVEVMHRSGTVALKVQRAHLLPRNTPPGPAGTD